MLQVHVREQAEKKHLNQTDLAEKCGLSRVTIHKYWLGTDAKLINVASLDKIAKALKCPSLALVREVEEE